MTASWETYTEYLELVIVVAVRMKTFLKFSYAYH